MIKQMELTRAVHLYGLKKPTVDSWIARHMIGPFDKNTGRQGHPYVLNLHDLVSLRLAAAATNFISSADGVRFLVEQNKQKLRDDAMRDDECIVVQLAFDDEADMTGYLGVWVRETSRATIENKLELAGQPYLVIPVGSILSQCRQDLDREGGV